MNFPVDLSKPGEVGQRIPLRPKGRSMASLHSEERKDMRRVVPMAALRPSRLVQRAHERPAYVIRIGTNEAYDRLQVHANNPYEI